MNVTKTRFSRIVPIVVTLALACGSGTGLFELWASSYQYSIVYSDGDSLTATGSFGGFAAFAIQPGAASGPWTVLYIIGDSLRLQQILPFGTQCPSAGAEPITSDSLAVDSVRAIVSLRKTGGTHAIPLTSSLTLDSVTAGEVWGHFTIHLVQNIPEFTGANATVTGQFRLAEIDYLSHARHCGGGSLP